MTKYQIKIGDNVRTTYGYDRDSAWKMLIESDPFIKFTNYTKDDLIQEGRNGYKDYLDKIGLDPFLK